MILLNEDDTLRVVIHTANLIPLDWGEKTQGVWMSPALYRKQLDHVAGLEGKHGKAFSDDLVQYLDAYGTTLKFWSDLVKQYNFSPVKVVDKIGSWNLVLYLLKKYSRRY